jgi:hypothetical protein
MSRNLFVIRDVRLSNLGFGTSRSDRFWVLRLVTSKSMQVEYPEIGRNHFLLYPYILIIHDTLPASFNAINLRTVGVAGGQY